MMARIAEKSLTLAALVILGCSHGMAQTHGGRIIPVRKARSMRRGAIVRPTHNRSGQDKMIRETPARLTVQKPAGGSCRRFHLMRQSVAIFSSHVVLDSHLMGTWSI